MHTLARRISLASLGLALCASLGCDLEPTGPTPVPDFRAGDTLVAARATVTQTEGATRYDGVIGGDNLYAFLVPEDWNGDLVLYAHGFIDAEAPLALPTNDEIEAIRDRIVADGFAFAYSGYRENGLAVKDGGWATRRVEALFRATVKTEPEHTWLMGHSLGGLIVTELAERYPFDYDGVLTFAGLNGGTAQQLDYVANVRILFDLFYPGCLPGSVLDIPSGYTVDMLVAAVLPRVLADPTGAFLISQVDQTPLPAPTNEALVQSLITALAFNVRGIDDVLERTHGQSPIDNLDTAYTSTSGLVPPQVLQMINAQAQRYDRTEGADAELRRNYEPNGRLQIPMIVVHRRWDPTVPLPSALRYREKVVAAGAGNHLELRIVEEYGHSSFSADFVSATLTDLVGAGQPVPTPAIP